MKDIGTFPIHRCIFRNDAGALEELLKDEEVQRNINQHDNHGNTPIHLALMLNRHSCLMILLKYDCDVFANNYFGWSPTNEAAMLSDIDALEKISYKMWNKFYKCINKQPGGYSYEFNKVTPFLFLKFKLKIRTSIPILKKLNGTFFFTIYKDENNLIYTTTIGGMDSRGIPKILKGNMSLLLNYNEKTDNFKVYGLNNAKKLFQELYPNIPDFYLRNAFKSKLGANKIINIHPNFSHFIIKPKKKGILKKNYKKFILENGQSYRAVAYKAKNFELVVHSRKDEAIINENESVIKNIIEEHNSSKEKSKKKNSELNNKDLKSSKTVDSDSDSDSNSGSDSDFDSDNEGNSSKYEEKSNKLNKEDERLLGYIDETFDEKHKDNGKDKDEVIMYTINRDGETKTFKYESTMESTLDWEQAYHEKYSKGVDLMYNVLGYGAKNNEKVKRLSPYEIEKLNLKKITEEEYFNPNSTKPLHLGRIMEVSEEKKPFNCKIRLWLAEESSNFPITFDNIQPLIKYFISMVIYQPMFNENPAEETSYINKLNQETYKLFTSGLNNLIEEKNTFPLKITIPIYPSVNLQVTTLDCSVDPKSVPEHKFKIPSDYTYGNVYFERIEK
ncbi:hypothetical protein BCR32DRAFT_289003 [Anaeromyces robustus]|uniref:Uncharacterized protein n=1 Tax=Anaeromyces robustus TaxID=1754192 RepID=A0A1Y1XQ68_9FUNG|nr:hypothetical protein BCR32DRAFT_289003 [Anaeromyces robustus]|eukprot:ORX87883.1 hypothetical protein BCR32DRAFT_289003 [Anaeromyces robustus]